MKHMLILNIAFVLLAIVGTEFIRRRDARGRYFWIAANIAAVLYFAATRQRWTVALFAYYFAASIFGLLRWRREERLAAPVPLYDEPNAMYTIPTWRKRARIRRHRHTALAPCIQRHPA